MVAEQVDRLVANYVAGTLPTPMRVLIESHLELKPESRVMADVLEAMAGDALEEIEAENLSDRSSMLEAVLASPSPPAERAVQVHSGGVFPRALRSFLGFDLDEVRWKTRLPGYKAYDIGTFDGLSASLFWFRPGRVVPAHTHSGAEVSLVLCGAFSDGEGHFRRGDVAIADDDIDHRPRADAGEPCIGFQVNEGPQILTGPFVERMRDLIG
jgi:putative transcriptional regulator